MGTGVAIIRSQFGVQLCLLGHFRAQWSMVPRLTELMVAHVFSQAPVRRLQLDKHLTRSETVSKLSRVLLKGAVLAL